MNFKRLARRKSSLIARLGEEREASSVGIPDCLARHLLSSLPVIALRSPRELFNDFNAAHTLQRLGAGLIFLDSVLIICIATQRNVIIEITWYRTRMCISERCGYHKKKTSVSLYFYHRDTGIIRERSSSDTNNLRNCHIGEFSSLSIKHEIKTFASGERKCFAR